MCKYYSSNFSQCQKYCLYIYPHQITFDVFGCTKFLLSPNIITYCFFDEHSTIITQYAQILLL